MRLNGKLNETETPPSLVWLEKHHPGRAIDLDERDFTEEVWNAAQPATTDDSPEPVAEPTACTNCEDAAHWHRRQALVTSYECGTCGHQENVKSETVEPVKCPKCGWMPVRVAS